MLSSFLTPRLQSTYGDIDPCGRNLFVSIFQRILITLWSRHDLIERQ